MNNHCRMTFTTTPEQKEDIAQSLTKQGCNFAISLLDKYDSERNHYSLVISGLPLANVLAICQALIAVYAGLYFTIQYYRYGGAEHENA